MFYILWKFLYYNKSGKLINTAIAEKLTNAEMEEQKISKKPMLRMFPVFNVFQTKDLPVKFYHIEAKEAPTEFEKNEKAEMLILSTNAKIIHKHGNEAFYMPTSDTITLPE